MQELVNALRDAQDIVLISHIRPDGDAVGSLLGLGEGLRSLGKHVTCVLKDGIPKTFDYLEGTTVVDLPLKADLCVVLDAPDSARTGYPDLVRAYAEANRLALIDHHVKGDLLRRAQYVVHNTDASSTSEIVTEIVQSLELKMTASMSTSLLTGMYTDTGGFQYGNTSTHTLEIAAELMRRGARLSKIVHYVSRQRTLPGLKLLGIALSRLSPTPDRLGVVTLLTLADLKSAEATPEDAAGLINALNVLPEAQYCMLITELEPGVVRGTLRTAEGHNFDVARFATVFGGGGHPKAAGFQVSGHIKPSSTGWRIESNLLP